MWFVQVVLLYLPVQDGAPTQPIIFRDTMVTRSAQLLPKRKTSRVQSGETFTCSFGFHVHSAPDFLLAGYNIACARYSARKCCESACKNNMHARLFEFTLMDYGRDMLSYIT